MTEEKMETPQVRTQVLAVLQHLQAGYTRRDPALSPALIEALFAPRADLLVLGTGDGEWNLGPRAAADLLQADWESWGDLSIDVEKAQVASRGSVAWLAAPAMVEFSYTEQKLTDLLLRLTRKFIAQEMPAREKVLWINWFLSQAMEQPGEAPWRFSWPLRLTAVLARTSANWQFHQLHFSFPLTARFPDERIDRGGMYFTAFENDLARLSAFHREQPQPAEPELVDALRCLQDEVLNGGAPARQAREKWLAPNALVIGLEDEWALNRPEALHLLAGYTGQWGKFSLRTVETLFATVGDTAWFALPGTISQLVDAAAVYQAQVDQIGAILEQPTSSKTRLMEIVRQVSSTLRDADTGLQAIWPFRLTGVCSREEAGWRFQQLHLSFPTDWGPFGKVDPLPGDPLRLE